MHDDPAYVSQLPEHPELREIAQVIETAGMMGEILDASFRCVFISSEAARAMGLSAEVGPRMIGMSEIVRSLGATTRGVIRVTRESGTAWWQHNAPIMRRYLEPGAPDFDEVFGPTAPAAMQLDPIEVAPRAWHDTVSFPPDLVDPHVHLVVVTPATPRRDLRTRSGVPRTPGA